MGVITGRAAEKISLLHYNDCCNVEGADRFLAAVKEQKETNPLVLFSGNIFSPSMSKSCSARRLAHLRSEIPMFLTPTCHKGKVCGINEGVNAQKQSITCALLT